MSWFTRKDKNIQDSNKKELPDDLWKKCSCGEILYIPELESANFICHHCSFHFPISSKKYLDIMLDKERKNLFENIVSTDMLSFKANKAYEDILKEVPENKEAVECYYGAINSKKVVIAIMNFKFIGGSMGSAVGEKISKSINYASDKNCPLIILCQSGGARMQEGAISLMQLAKTTSRLAKFSKNGGLYISILTDPTTGGVTASFGMLGDIILAEPGALIGFAGPRVIKQTIGQDLPTGFQRSEFLLKKGFIDHIVHRKNMKQEISTLISMFS